MLYKYSSLVGIIMLEEIMQRNTFKLSIVVPIYNEALGLVDFNKDLTDELTKLGTIGLKDYEIIYVDDGSSDNSATIIKDLQKQFPTIKLVVLSRNFGKESALASGIAIASNEAVITMDGDSQHPVDVLPELIAKWQDGARVVIGVRRKSKSDGIIKKLNSRLFYATFNKLTHQKLTPNATDFRLIDRQVQKEFLKLNESDRITRGLIDWLGFDPAHVMFDARIRKTGKAGYSNSKLLGLATNTFVSLTSVPLYLVGYLGLIITSLSLILGVAVFFEQLLLGDPLSWNFTGTAMLSILILFLMGLVLIAQGIMSLYISTINNQSKNRPLYIIDYEKSSGI